MFVVRLMVEQTGRLPLGMLTHSVSDPRRCVARTIAMLILDIMKFEDTE